jgi:hypothetical protein
MEGMGCLTVTSSFSSIRPLQSAVDARESGLTVKRIQEVVGLIPIGSEL